MVHSDFGPGADCLEDLPGLVRHYERSLLTAACRFLVTEVDRQSCAAGLGAVECMLSGGQESCMVLDQEPCGAPAFSNLLDTDAE